MADLSGQTISRYQVIERLGEGGMATVYRAYDTRLDCDVALKIIRRGAFPPDALERLLKRFEREARVLARLNHPNIVSVVDYGDLEGAPYLVMRYMPGGTLRRRMDHVYPAAEAAALLLPIARALDYAHGLQVLHRDVKPANILLTETDEPVLSDFGIARLLETGESHTLTGTGVGIGTPEYMAPEQSMGNAVDGRADMYSLGVIFYEMITGRKPFEGTTPMAVMFKHVSEPLPAPRKLVPSISGEVEKVLYRALAKKPQDRYPSMADFASALERIAAVGVMSGKGQKIPARVEKRPQAEGKTPTPTPPWAKTPTPNPTPSQMEATADIAATPGPAAGLAGDGLEAAVRLPGEAGAVPGARGAQANAGRLKWIKIGGLAALAVAVIAGVVLAVPRLAKTPAAPTSQPTALAAATMMLPTAGESPAVPAAEASATGEAIPTGALSPTEQTSPTPPPTQEPRPVITADTLNRLIALAQYAPENGIMDAAPRPSHGQVLLMDRGGVLYQRDIDTLLPAGTTAASTSRTTFAISPDGERWAYGRSDKHLNVVELDSGKILHSFSQPPGYLKRLVYSPDGSLLAITSDATQEALLVNADSGQVVFRMPVNNPLASLLVFSPDGSLLAVTNSVSTIIIDTRSHQKVVGLSSGGEPKAVAFSPDGKQLAIARKNMVYLYKVGKWEYQGVSAQDSGEITGLAYSPDGSMLVFGSDHGKLIFWSTAKGAEIARVQGPDLPVRFLFFSPSGEQLVSAATNQMVVWGLLRPGERAAGKVIGRENAAGLSRLAWQAYPSVQDAAAIPGTDEMLVLMNYAPFRARVDTLEQTGDLGTGTYLSMGLAAAPDGNAAALGQSDKQVRVVRLADRQALFAFGPTINRPSGLAYSPDGRLLAVSGPDSSATIHDAANGKPVAVVRLAEQVFETLAFTPDSRQLLLGYAGGLLVVDAASGSTIANIPFGALPPNAVAVARGGGLMAAAAGNTILLIQPGEWKVAQTLSMPESSATALAFSADGSLLAAGSADGKVWLWDAAAGKALGSIVIDESGALAVTRVLFNSPGDRLAAVTEQSVSVWRSP